MRVIRPPRPRQPLAWGKVNEVVNRWAIVNARICSADVRTHPPIGTFGALNQWGDLTRPG